MLLKKCYYLYIIILIIQVCIFSSCTTTNSPQQPNNIPTDDDQPYIPPSYISIQNTTPIPTLTPSPLPVPTPSTPPGIAPMPADSTNIWTIMVYLDGDNDLDPYAIQDINSMELVGSTDKVKIVVQYDTSGNYGTRRYLITKDYDQINITSPVLENIGEVNMGTSSSLTQFIQFCVTHYPAQKYSLILWNHGNGFKKPGNLQKDICWDDTSGGDALTIPELAQAINQAGVSFDLIAMDACMMGMLEVAYEIRNNTKLFVASEENVPAEGLNYQHFLENLVASPYMDNLSLARSMIDSYLYSYPFGTSLTMAAIDCQSLTSLAIAVNGLAESILNDKKTSKETYRTIVTRETICFSDVDFIDLGDFSYKLTYDPRILSSQVTTSAQQVENQIKNTILYHQSQGNNDYWTINNARGISIYLPIYNKYLDKYNHLQFAQDTRWDELINFLSVGRR